MFLSNTSDEPVLVELEFVLRVLGQKIQLKHTPFMIAAGATEPHTLDLLDFIPPWVTPPQSPESSSLLVLSTSATISTRARLSVSGEHIGYTYAPTIFGHLEFSPPPAKAVLYREGALLDTYYGGDLARWRAGGLTYTGEEVIMSRMEILGSFSE